MMSEKRFKSPIENALRGRKFGVKLGKNRGYPYWILTPTKGFFRFRIQTSVPNFVEIGSKLRPYTQAGIPHSQQVSDQLNFSSLGAHFETS